DAGVGADPNITVPVFTDSTDLRVFQAFGIAESKIIVGCAGILKEDGAFARGYPYTSLRIGSQGIYCVRGEPVTFLLVFQEFSLRTENEDSFAESPYPQFAL